MRQIEEMEQKEETAQAGPCSPQLEGRVGHGNEKVGRSMETKWAVVGQAAKLRRQRMQSARTTAKEAGAREAAGRASASTTAQEKLQAMRRAEHL